MLFHKCKHTDETVCRQGRADYLEKIKFAGLCSTERNLTHRIEISNQFNSKMIISLIRFVYLNYDEYYKHARLSICNEFNS